MSDSEISSELGVPQTRMNQRSRLVIIAKGTKIDRKTFAIHEVVKAHPGVFLIEKRKKRISDFLKNLPHIRFRKAREIPKSDSRKNLPFQEKTFNVIAYSLSKPTPQQKKKMQRIIYRTACIKVRPGVLLLPHLRAKEKKRYYSVKNGFKILDSTNFVKEAREVGAVLHRWSRLKLVNQQGEDIIQEAYNETIENETKSIIKRLKNFERLSMDESKRASILKKDLSNISRRIQQLRIKHNILRSIWYYENEKEIKRAYNQMLRIRRKLQET